MADFLREIRDISTLRHRQEEVTESSEHRRADEKLPDITLSHSERALFLRENDVAHDLEGEMSEQKSGEDNRSTGGGFPVTLDLFLLTSCSLGAWSRSPDRLRCDNRDPDPTTGWAT